MKTKQYQFKVGDRVRVKHLERHERPFINKSLISSGSMKETEGTIGEIVMINGLGNILISGPGFIYPPSSLEKIPKRLPPIKVGDKVKVYRKIYDKSKFTWINSQMDVALTMESLTVLSIGYYRNGYKYVTFKELHTDRGYHWRLPFSCIKRA